MDGPLTLRPATPADAASLRRLAQLDTCDLPPGPHLLAERDGRVDAAISLASGAVVANPFQRTAELCDLLRRAASARDGRGARFLRPIRPRPLPAPA